MNWILITLFEWDENPDCLQLSMVQLMMIFQFYNSVKWYIFSRNCNLWFWILLFPWASSMTLSMMGGGSQFQITCEIVANNLIHLETILFLTTILFFTFRTVFSKLREIFNILVSTRICVGWFCPTVGYNGKWACLR